MQTACGRLTSSSTLLRTVDADIIGLQECDTARIANGNADIVKYFADRLDLYSYYGPKTVTGTFGIALLSKYPIEDPQTVYLYSLGEQTAADQGQDKPSARRPGTSSSRTWAMTVRFSNRKASWMSLPAKKISS